MMKSKHIPLIHHAWIRQAQTFGGDKLEKWYVQLIEENRGITFLFKDGTWKLRTPDELNDGGFFDDACQAEEALRKFGYPRDTCRTMGRMAFEMASLILKNGDPKEVKRLAKVVMDHVRRDGVPADGDENIGIM